VATNATYINGSISCPIPAAATLPYTGVVYVDLYYQSRLYAGPLQFYYYSTVLRISV
jgi:hypothetical protein